MLGSRVPLGIRITLTIAVLLSLLLFISGYYRVSDVETRMSLEASERTEEVARLFRGVLETNGAAKNNANAKSATRLFTSNHPKWSFEVKRLSNETDWEGVPIRRVEKNGFLRFSLPLRIPLPNTDSGFDIVGEVLVARPMAPVRAAIAKETRQTTTSMLTIFGFVFIGTLLTVTTLVVRPLKTLLQGIDGVASGDLSQAVLEQRDDEFGQLADRFNEMTQSLRESRQETETENAAKLSLEQRLRHSETMATVGQLAAEIAHEVGTPLNVISGRAKGIIKKQDNKEAVTRNAEIIAEQTSRITRIIQRLLDLTRKKLVTPGSSKTDVDEVISSALELLEGQLQGGGIRSSLSLQCRNHFVSLDRDQLYQVVLNLVVNSIQAMKNSKRKELAITTIPQKQKRPGVESEEVQSVILLIVSDSGVGIPDQDKERIFEPFHSTKGDSGTGLGLAVVAGIIRDIEGWIEVVDTKGGGAQFNIFLPAAV